MTAENMDPVVKSWLNATSVEPPDPRRAAHPIMAHVARTKQRGRWWPLPSFERTSTPARSIPATNGHAPTAIGRTMPKFSATRSIVVGVVVALFGGVLLIAQPFGQQGMSVPGAGTTQAPPSVHAVLPDAVGDMSAGAPAYIDITGIVVSVDDDALTLRFEVAGDVPLENTVAMLDEITGHRDTDSERTPGEIP